LVRYLFWFVRLPTPAIPRRRQVGPPRTDASLARAPTPGALARARPHATPRPLCNPSRRRLTRGRCRRAASRRREATADGVTSPCASHRQCPPAPHVGCRCLDPSPMAESGLAASISCPSSTSQGRRANAPRLDQAESHGSSTVIDIGKV